MTPFPIRPLTPADLTWLPEFWQEHWGSPEMVVNGQVYRIEDLAGFVCQDGERVVGLVSYRLAGQGCEVMSLDSLEENRGLGSALLAAVAGAARAAGCKRLFLTTTNDNLRALGFYQKRGFRLCELRPGAVAQARQIKPSIPLTGFNDIPLRDEIELELWLDESAI